jgi:hypothetical protein
MMVQIMYTQSSHKNQVDDRYTASKDYKSTTYRDCHEISLLQISRVAARKIRVFIAHKAHSRYFGQRMPSQLHSINLSKKLVS